MKKEWNREEWKKNQWKMWSVSAALSILIVGVATGLRFDDLAVPDSRAYTEMNAVYAIAFLTAVLGTTRNLYLLVDLMTDRYRIFALLIAVINPMACLLLAILAYAYIEGMTEFKQMHPGVDPAGRIIFVLILTGFMTFQVIIEVKVVRKAWRFVKG